MHRVTDKKDKAEVSTFVNEEFARHISYTKTKKGA